MFVKIRPDYIEKSKKEHSADAKEDAQVFPSHVFYFGEQLVTPFDVFVSYLHDLLIDSQSFVGLRS
jgi:hypothetical protein